MKLILVVAVLFTVALVSESKGPKCNTQKDCEDESCCRRQGLFSAATCEPRSAEGEECIRDGPFAFLSSVCPCQKGLKCERPEELFGKMKCGKAQEPSTTVKPEESTE